MDFAALALMTVLSMNQGAPPDFDSLHLPAAVKIVALFYTNEKLDTPFCKFIAEIGPDWARSEQHLADGSFGFILKDFRFDTMEGSLAYSADTRRGRRSMRMSVAGFSSVEPMLTPIAYIRVAKLIQSRGGSVETRVDGGLVVYSFSAPASGMPHIEIVVDPESSEVREVRQPGAVKAFVTTYSNWEQLPDGTHHPKNIRTEDFLNGKHDRSDMTIIQSMELLDPKTGPTPYELPADASIFDELAGVVTDGSGKTIGQLVDFDTPPGGRIPKANSRGWANLGAIGGGVALIGLSAWLWRQRRRAAGVA